MTSLAQFSPSRQQTKSGTGQHLGPHIIPGQSSSLISRSSFLIPGHDFASKAQLSLSEQHVQPSTGQHLSEKSSWHCPLQCLEVFGINLWCLGHDSVSLAQSLLFGQQTQVGWGQQPSGHLVPLLHDLGNFLCFNCRGERERAEKKSLKREEG